MSHVDSLTLCMREREDQNVTPSTLNRHCNSHAYIPKLCIHQENQRNLRHAMRTRAQRLVLVAVLVLSCAPLRSDSLPMVKPSPLLVLSLAVPEIRRLAHASRQDVV